MNHPLNSPDSLRAVLHHKFGQSEFRSSQLEVIQSVLNGDDLLVVLPTGHGKSLTFQLPAVVQSSGDGFYIVISPLLALMRDQVQQLQNRGIAADTINSMSSSDDRKRVFQEFGGGGNGCLLYVSPEQCFSAGFRGILQQIGPHKVQRVVVDEAHCAVEWGSDFRHDYARLGSELRKLLGSQVPLMALTGTASPQMQHQITTTLQLRSPRVFSGGSARPHLHYEVRYVEDAGDRVVDMLKFLKMYRGRIAKLAASGRAVQSGYPGCGIVYCRNRASTELIANECNQELGQCAAAYHAGLSAEERSSVMEKWMMGDPKVSVVVATVAFGLGIDKPDTRFVIHFDLPQNIEAYVQQTGRAGRDRKAARCILYYSLDDSRRCMRFASQRSGGDASREATIALLKFATTINRCRHDMLVEYFDSNRPERLCDYACDFCKMPRRLHQRYEDWYSQI